VRISVQGGTVNHERRSLCESCRWSTVIRGPKLGDEIVECNQLSYYNQRVSFPVTSCSRYSDLSRPSVREMEEIAWVLRADPRRSRVGFVHSSKLADDERYVLPDD
jgi:hypothetical protein